MQFASCFSCCLLCMGLHIQMTLLAEVTEFAFLQPETTDRKKKSWLSISLITFFEGKSINLNLLLLTELLSASPTIYICEGLLENTLHASIDVDELYLRNLLSLKNAGTLLPFLCLFLQNHNLFFTGHSMRAAAVSCLSGLSGTSQPHIFRNLTPAAEDISAPCKHLPVLSWYCEQTGCPLLPHRPGHLK